MNLCMSMAIVLVWLLPRPVRAYFSQSTAPMVWRLISLKPTSPKSVLGNMIPMDRPLVWPPANRNSGKSCSRQRMLPLSGYLHIFFETLSPELRPGFECINIEKREIRALDDDQAKRVYAWPSSDRWRCRMRHEFLWILTERMFLRGDL